MLAQTDLDLDSLTAIAKTCRLRSVEGQAFGWLGQILLNVDDRHAAEAEHWIRKGIDASERNGTRFFLAMNYRIYADFFQRQGDRTKTQESLGRAIEIFRECGASGWVKRTEEKLAKL